MNEIKTFTWQPNVTIRTVDRDGEPWFVGKDVAIALGYSDTVNALKTHVAPEDKMGWQITTPSRGQQNATIINESGLYALIFGSKLPSAQDFKHWVTSEVLPSIRKTGRYGRTPFDDIFDGMMADMQSPAAVAQMQREATRMRLNADLNEAAKALADVLARQSRCETALAHTKKQYQQITAMYHEAKSFVADAKADVCVIRGRVETLAAQLRALEGGDAQ